MPAAKHLVSFWSGVIAVHKPELLSTPDSDYNLEFDIFRCQSICQRVRDDPVFAQNLYAALCNTVWQYKDAWYILKDNSWSCSWRNAGSIVAHIRGTGDYLDWYCSGMSIWKEGDGEPPSAIEQQFLPEGQVSKEIEQALALLGWHCIYDTEKI